MKRCKHENTVVRYLACREAMVWQPWTNYMKRCADCHETLSLGPSSDDDPNVQIELRAACLALLTRAEWLAEESAMEWAGRVAWPDLGPPCSASALAGWLAAAIATHNDTEGGE